MKDQYKQLLDLFKLKEENDRFGRTWMQSPFSFADKTAATNAYSVVIVPEKSDYQILDYTVTFLSNYSQNLWIDIPLSWLKDAIKKIPFEFPPVCEACEGLKTVNYHFQYEYKVFEEKKECPICEGSGRKDRYQRTYHSKAFSENVGVKIGYHIFSGDRIIELIESCRILNTNTVTMVSQTNKYDKTVFTVNEVEVFCMPIHSFEDEISYCDDFGQYLRDELKEEK